MSPSPSLNSMSIQTKLSYPYPLLNKYSPLIPISGTIDVVFLLSVHAAMIPITKNNINLIENGIFKIANELDFFDLCKEIYLFQSTQNRIYQNWINLTQKVDKPIENIVDFPFLPISAFKNHRVTATENIEQVFTSSSTSGQGISSHHVHNLKLYEHSFIESFRHFYGSFHNFRFFALLPNYLERNGSSLVYMANYFIQNSPLGGDFYLYNHEQLLHDIRLSLEKKEKIILLGVTFALIDFAEIAKNTSFENCIIMETGGMKGRGKELTRNELHQLLCNAYSVENIHSEYGMTELLSQAYSAGNGRFVCPPWMKILIQDASDPGVFLPIGKTGRVCIIDLANIYSCSFIATDDLGKVHSDGSFEIMGRLDFSDVRGCSQLAL